MRVLHLLPSDRYSGAENVVCQIMSFFKETQGVEMLYCSPNGPIRSALEERDIPFSPLNEFSVQTVKAKLREVQPDIVHAHDMKASVVAAMASGNIPLISHVHNNNFNSRGISAKALLYYAAAKKSSHIFWVSKSSFEGYCFHKSFQQKSTVLYNIIDANALRQKAKMDGGNYHYDIVYLGRLTPQKNPQRLMIVLRMIAQANPDVSVAVVGTGDLDSEVRALAKEYGLEGNIDFLGFQSNPYKLLQDAKLMIMTSRWEGTPMCALEAMALGVPIVSTPTDGLCELVDNGVTGYLSDEDGKIVQGCLRIMNDSQMRASMSQATLAKAALIMDIETYKKAIMTAYTEALK